jgi:ethanolamine utilization microcompartment shell protein EutL
MQLRTYVMIDRMQPQYAAFTGKRTMGMIPIEGDAQIFIEISPAAEVYKVMDTALKTTNVQPGFLNMGREYGFLEIHSSHQEAVKYTGEKALESMNLKEADRLKPKVLSANMTSGIHPYEAQLINAGNAGSLVLANQSFCVIEVVPAAYIVLAANEAEKAAGITLNHYTYSGAYGRLMISGSDSAVRQSRDAAISAIESLDGRIPGK